MLVQSVSVGSSLTGDAHGPAAWSSGFLPSRHQGVQFRTGAKPLFYLDNPSGVTSARRKDVIDTLGKLNSLALDRYHDPEIETRIAQLMCGPDKAQH